jgi:outer membrane receptor protein involved in Fe transport/opacity protein-like surface antigen
MLVAFSPVIAFGQDDGAGAGGAVTLQTVTVEAERPDWEKILSPGSVSVVMPDDFKGEQKNLGDMLDQVPGLHINRVTGTGQYTTVQMRGSTAAQVNVYVDGVLQNVGNDMAVDLSLIPVSQVARIEVYRGYVPVRFAGSPIGGVINIVTKKAESLGVTAEAGLKSLGGQIYNLTASLPTFWGGSLLLGGHYDTSDADFKFTRGPWFYSQQQQIYHPGVTTTTHRRHNEYSNEDLMLKWQNDYFSLKAAYKETTRHLPDPVGIQEHFTDMYRFQDANQTELVAGYRNTWGNLDLGLQLFYMDQNKDSHYYNIPDGPAWGGIAKAAGMDWQNRETEKYGAQMDVSYNLGDRHLLELHADYSKEKLYIDASPFYRWGGTDWVILPGRNYWPKYTEERAHFQAQDTITLGNDDSTKLTVIGRMDKARSGGNMGDDAGWRGSWGAALVKDVDDNLSFRFSTGTFNRYPNFTERFGDGIYVMPTWIFSQQHDFWGNFAWETGEQWDIGLDWNGQLLGARNRTSLSYFNRYTENMIQMYFNRAFSFFESTGKGRVDGVEFETHFNWDQFDLDFSTTWQQGRMNYSDPWGITNGNKVSAGMGEKIMNLPEWEFFLRGNYRLPGDKLSFYAEYHHTDQILRDNKAVDIRITNSTTQDALVYDDPLRLINAGLRWQVSDQISVIAGVNDLLNKGPRQGSTLESSLGRTTYASLIDYPREGRTYFATLRYEFGGHESLSANGSAPAAGGDFSGIKEIGEDGSFYIAPKLIYSQMRTKLSGEDLTFSGGPDGTKYSYEMIPGMPETAVWMKPGSNFNIPIFGGQHSQSSVAGGLAFGYDLHKLYGVPLRFEVEGSLHSRQDISHRSYAFGQANPISHQPHTLNYATSEQALQTNSASLLLNAFWDFHNSTRFTPYIGVGIGATRYHHKVTENIAFTYGALDFEFIPPSEFIFYYPFEFSQSSVIRSKPLDRTEKGWALTWNVSAGFSYQLSPSTHLDFSYRYVDYGKQKLPTATPNALVQSVAGSGPFAGEGSVMAYGSGTGQTLELKSHQAVLALRFDLGVGEQTIAEYNRKKEGAISFLSGLTGPDPLDGPAIRPGSFTIGLHLGGWFPSSDFGVADGFSGGLSLGYNFTQNWGLEASFDITDHANSNFIESYSGKARIGSAHLNAIYHLVDPENDDSRWVPYATAGLGYVWSKGSFQNEVVYSNPGNSRYQSNQPTGGDYSSFAVNAGVGLKYFLHENVALRLEALDTFAFKDADFGRDTGPYHNLAVTGGLTFQFGGN